jgi:hypothetical protein
MVLRQMPMRVGELKLVVECREFPKSAGPGGSNDGNSILALPDDYSSLLDILGTQQNSQPHQKGIPYLGERPNYQRERSCESLRSLRNGSHLQPTLALLDSAAWMPDKEVTC